ncbi:MAG: glycosyltransferase family 4 protein [Melioribacteraceae bacterium]|nr:glycosyltransferase family 4 protein [Melioribacteraceae bacterium]
MKYKIAYLGNQIAYAGGAMSLYLMVMSLDGKLFDRYLYSSNCDSVVMKDELEKELKEVKLLNIKQIVSVPGHKTSLLRFFLYRITAKKQAYKIINILIKNKIDILHINNSVFSHLYPYLKTYKNLKIVTHLREEIHYNGIGLIQKYIINNIFKYSDALISINQKEAEPFIHHHNLHVVPNPFDFSSLKAKLDLNETRRKLNINENTIVVGMLGRFTRNKGQLLFIEVIKEIIKMKEYKNVVFLIIGSQPPKPFWKRMAKKVLFKEDYAYKVMKAMNENNIKSKIKLIQYSYGNREYHQILDIVVRPSLYSDPWGRDIIESMALRKPIIATGKSEMFVKNGESGYLVYPINKTKIAEKIIELIDNPLQREKFGENGYNIVYKQCNTVTYSEKIENIYKKLLSI